MHQYIARRREVKPDLVGLHRAISVQNQLLLLDPVLHLATDGVELLVDVLVSAAMGWQVGDHERDWPCPGGTALADDAALARTGLPRAVGEVT